MPEVVTDGVGRPPSGEAGRLEEKRLRPDGAAQIGHRRPDPDDEVETGEEGGRRLEVVAEIDVVDELDSSLAEPGELLTLGRRRVVLETDDQIVGREQAGGFGDGQVVNVTPRARNSLRQTTPTRRLPAGQRPASSATSSGRGRRYESYGALPSGPSVNWCSGGGEHHGVAPLRQLARLDRQQMEERIAGSRCRTGARASGTTLVEPCDRHELDVCGTSVGAACVGEDHRWPTSAVERERRAS